MDYHASDAGEVIDQVAKGISDGSVIWGGKGNDTITFGNVNVVGSAGSDTLTSNGTWGAAVYWDSPAGVRVDLAKGTALDGFGSTDTLINVNNVQGSGFSDVLIGNVNNNSFFGNGGDDVVIGGGGVDVFSYYNVKSSDASITYDAATDTFTVVKHFANGDNGTDRLTGISRVEFVGELSDHISYVPANFVAQAGFLRLQPSQPIALPEGASLQQIKTGDFNGDGQQDWMITTQVGTGTAAAPTYFFAGDGAGNFTDATQSIIPGGYLGISGGGRTLIADFNQDGRSDVFQLNFGDDAPPFPGGVNTLLLSSPQSGFLVDRSSTLSQTLQLNHGGSIGDVNGDGYADVLVNTLSHGSQLYLNDGKGGLALHDELLPPADTGLNSHDNTYSGIVDVDGDGHPDLILGRWDGGNSTADSLVLLNDGTGDFSRSAPIALPASGLSKEIILDVKAIDLNHDGRIDLMLSVTNGGERDVFYQTPYIQLLINDGGGNFHDETAARISPAVQATFGSKGWIMSLTNVDMDRDGNDDILVTSASDSVPSMVLMNRGDGTFDAGWSSGVGGHTVALDANNDGMTDLVTYYNNMAPAVDVNVMESGHVYKVAADAIGGVSLTGSSGNDILIGGAGSDHIDGGAGVDAARYSGKRSDYTVTHTAAGDSVSGGGASDTLINIERLMFADSAIAYDVDGVGGQAYRLYQAAFNRAPDTAGLGFQMWAMESAGYSLAQVAQNFIDSPEFSRTYGSLSNEQFVTQLYANVLHRAPDAEGLKFHVDLLNAGTVTRAVDLVGFSESPENKAALIGVIGNGFEYVAHT